MLSLARLSPGMQLLFLFFAIPLSAAIFTLIGAFLNAYLFDVSLLDNPTLLDQIDQPNVLSALKLIQILQHIGIFIVPTLVFAYLIDRKPLQYLRINKSAHTISYIGAVIIIILALPLINWMITINEAMVLPEFLTGLETWMKGMEESATGITKKFLIMDSPLDLTINLFMIALIPAIGEEMLFRGVLQRIFANWTKNIHLGVWITAILFSAMHMQFYGFLPRMMLGVLFGYLFVWSGSLLLPMLCHLINNGSAVIFAYVAGVDEFMDQDESLGTAEGETLLTLTSALAIAGLLYMIYKKEKEKRSTA